MKTVGTLTFGKIENLIGLFECRNSNSSGFHRKVSVWRKFFLGGSSVLLRFCMRSYSFESSIRLYVLLKLEILQFLIKLKNMNRIRKVLREGRARLGRVATGAKRSLERPDPSFCNPFATRKKNPRGAPRMIQKKLSKTFSKGRILQFPSATLVCIFFQSIE